MNNRISLLGLSVYTLVVGGLLIGVGSLTTWALQATGLSPELTTVFAGLDSAGVVIALTVALEMRISKVSFTEALQSGGLKRGTSLQIKTALIGLAPLALAYLMLFAALEISADTVPDLPWVMLKFFIAQGLAEEIVFRGFVFRHLRGGRSFLHASTLSAVLFSLIHVANFSHGFSQQMLVAVSLSIVFGFVLTYPLSLLFELGAGSIAGGALLHVGVDSINWFQQAAASGVGLSVYLLGVAGSAAVILILCKQRLVKT
jgi:membrane protease YdiL (CAAX protease family)